MDYSFIIRRAEPTRADALAVQSVMRDSFEKYKQHAGVPNTPGALSETLEDILDDIKNSYVYLAVVDGEPVGSIRINIETPEYAYIKRFGVREGYQSIGIGKSFMNLVDKLLRSKGVKYAGLHTASKYTALVRFYYGCGFYVKSTEDTRGYLRAYLVKDYQ